MSSTRWSPVVLILSLSCVLLASGFQVSAQLFTVQIGEVPPVVEQTTNTTITTLCGLSRPQRVRLTNAPAPNTVYRVVAQ